MGGWDNRGLPFWTDGHQAELAMGGGMQDQRRAADQPWWASELEVRRAQGWDSRGWG